MSENKILPVAIFSFLAGVFVGAVVALLNAPATGQELRAQIRSEADEAARRLSAEWKDAVQDIRQNVDEGQHQLKGYLAKLQGKETDKPEGAV